MKNLIVTTYLIFLFVFSGFCQEGVTTFGFQYKPIIPNRFIGTHIEDFSAQQMQATLKQKFGHSFGGVIRTGLNKTISLETGINLVYRNFNLDFSIPDSSLAANGNLLVVSYEIPVSCLVFIRLSDELYMNTSLGLSMNFFSSNVQKELGVGNAQYFDAEGAYKSKIQGAMNANFGFEYRTRSAGFYYLGLTYQLPFTPMMDMALSYEYPGGNVLNIKPVTGSFLTVDLRYFFPVSKD